MSSLASPPNLNLVESDSRNSVKLPELTRRLRVCHLSLTLKTGGLERLLADFARLHCAKSIDPQFMAMQEIGRFGQEIRGYGRDVHVLKSRHILAKVRELAHWLRHKQIDVLHTHNAYPHVWGTVAGRLAGTPVIVQTRHGQRAGRDWKARVKYRWASYWASRVVGVSDDATQLSIHEDGIPASKVTRIWNGIDLSQFPYRGPSPGAVAISVARLSAEKDFPTLIRAAGLVAREVPEFRLIMVGDGAERPALVALSESLGLSQCVSFVGERTDVPQLLAQASFFVSSSLTEGISLTLLEAMATGLPVVATAVGGNPEIVEEGKTGFLVSPADPRLLADAIVRMCQQTSTQLEMAQTGRRRVEEHFDVRRMVSDYERLYQSLFAERGVDRQ